MRTNRNGYKMESRQTTPAYLKELENGGYHHLSYHLQNLMNCVSNSAVSDYCENFTFSAFSQFVIEARLAIIKKVKSIIPVDFEGDIVFLIGNTGSGKSTALLMLSGQTLRRRDFGYEVDEDQNDTIGCSRNKSHTFLPNILLVNNTYYVDFPGFLDSFGNALRLAEDLALKALINLYQPKLFVVQSVDERMQCYSDLKMQLAQFTERYDSVLLGLSKYIRTQTYIMSQSSKDKVHLNKIHHLSVDVTIAENNIQIILSMKNDLSDFDKHYSSAEQNLALAKNALLLAQKEFDDAKCEAGSDDLFTSTDQSILNELGLHRMVRLDDLENPQVRQSCLQALAALPRQPKSSKPYITPNHQVAAMINALYQKSIIDRLYQHEYASIVPVYSSKAIFSDASSRSSFLEVTQSKEIGDFLTLPELDPAILKKYDHALRKDCVERYAEAILRLNLQNLKSYFKQHRDAARYQALIAALRALIVTMKSHLLPPGISKDQAKMLLLELTKSPCKSINKLSAEFTLPAWCRSFPFIYEIVPVTLHQVLVEIDHLQKKDKLRRLQSLLANQHPEDDKASSAHYTTNGIFRLFSVCKKMITGEANVHENQFNHVDEQVENDAINLSDQQLEVCLFELKTLQQTLSDLDFVTSSKSLTLYKVFGKLTSMSDAVTDTETLDIEGEEKTKVRFTGR